MAIVPLDQLWVDANFKEVQLRKMRIGQPVTLEADLYGGKVEYKGKIVGLSAGTGSAFSLLPAQNATGNWIKVVQRVPVRIEFDRRNWPTIRCASACRSSPRIDTSNQDGQQLAAAKRVEPSYATQAFAPDTHAVDALIDGIVAANLGKQSSASSNVGAAASVPTARRTTAERLARAS